MKTKVKLASGLWCFSLILIGLNLILAEKVIARGVQSASDSWITNSSKKNDFLLAFSGFSDISGITGETQIQQLAQLGVIETDSTTFRPSEFMTRGQFVAWLIKTYNQLHRNPIRLSSTTVSAFPDVPSSHPYFNYIQSAYEAGFLVGFEDGTFQPDTPLTREQMIALKSQLDSTGYDRRSPETLRQFITKTRGFTDADEMSDQYLKYIAFDLGNAAGGKNFQRVYGTTRIYNPKRPVTREEAAILLSQFRKGKSISEVLESR